MSQPREFTIPRRDATLGSNIPFRTQHHGDLKVRAGDVPFSELILDARELGELLQEPLAHRALYVKLPGAALEEPFIRAIDVIPLAIKLSGRVSVFSPLGDHEIDLGLCTITKLKIERKTGGLTALQGAIQTTPTLDSRIAELIDRMGEKVQLAIAYEHEAEQQQLPMGEGAEGTGNGDAAPVNGSADPQFEAAAKEQVAAFKRGRRAKSARKGAH